MSFSISQCSACGHRVFPARLWCPACGHDRAHPAAVQEAEIQAWTVAPAQGAEAVAVLATARALPEGPILVVRLDTVPSRVGQRVDLTDRGEEDLPLPWGCLRPD
ncbi:MULTISPECIES: Zn-ribbon domain-containing OB-fold protein [Achromobacter]|uniref:Predicted nucleic-acid-binding protein containing a Zn-ribbon n=1 Tax=Achromobacter aegrifaciens TaxID=1287736 RepID=A0AAD2KLZ0_ACHAE|nr:MULTISPECIES: zinc ribbon domain-containing protein [Achromobacter]CAB3921042.1 hypothetical protein LMG26684_05707 [Achromobacter mucicolens]CUJ72235.1 Predicted nucleic-acid-binding protein containing a Zn-ribbon [Achromobacter aegrifaciens]